MKTTQSQRHHEAFSLTEVLVIIAVLALLAGLLLPAQTHSKSKAIRINCINNLKQVGMAFRMWSDDHGLYPMQYRTNSFDGPSFATQQKMYVYFQTMSNELSTPKIICCPGDDRLPATNFASLSNTNISYFLGMDADETMPQMFLAGDRNLTTNSAPVPSGLALIKSADTIGWTQKNHQGQGNVALADGSVQGERQVPGQPGTNVMRLAIP